MRCWKRSLSGRWVVARRTRRIRRPGYVSAHMSIPTSGTPVRVRSSSVWPGTFHPAAWMAGLWEGPVTMAPTDPSRANSTPRRMASTVTRPAPASVPSQGPTDSIGGHAWIHSLGAQEEKGFRPEICRNRSLAAVRHYLGPDAPGVAQRDGNLLTGVGSGDENSPWPGPLLHADLDVGFRSKLLQDLAPPASAAGESA